MFAGKTSAGRNSQRRIGWVIRLTGASVNPAAWPKTADTYRSGDQQTTLHLTFSWTPQPLPGTGCGRQRSNSQK